MCVMVFVVEMCDVGGVDEVVCVVCDDILL